MARIARVLDTASVRIEVDVRRAERDAEHAGEDAGRAYAKGANRETKRNPTKLKLDPITADFEQQVRAAVAKIAKSLNADVPLTIKGERLRAQAAVAIAEIERTLSAKIPTDPAGALEYRRKLALLVREASRGVEANIDLDVDRNGIRRAGSTFAGIATSGIGAFAELGATIKGVAGEAISSISGMSGPLLSVLKAIFAIQYVVPGMAAGITLAGGAGVAAFGAISAAALGLPVVLFSLGAPIAAIMLGMDGIKRAAAPLADEFKHLKDVVNIAFELGMRPVFEKLQALFPTVSVGMGEVSRAVVRIASDLTTVITSEAGIENLRVAFGGVSDVVDKSREGVANLFSALLNVAGTAPLYDILGETIGGVAARFGNMIERVRSSGDLERALASLRDVLFGVVDMLNVLIEGSIKFFAAAGPGLSSFFASLTEVLSRIDWASLGESFGGMMERLGKAIQDVPPEKWQEMADAIGVLSERFIKMIEEGAISDFVEGIASIANVLLLLKDIIDGIQDGLNGFNDAIGGAGDSVYENFTKPIYGAVTDLMEWLGIKSPAQKLIDIGLAMIEGMLVGLAGGPAAVFAKVRELAQAALNALSDAGTFLVDKGRQFVEGVRAGISEKLGDARARAIEIKDNIKNALADAANWLFTTGTDMVEGFIRGIGSKISSAASKAAEMARSAYNAAKSVLGISSPSTLFAAIGRNTVDGFMVGLQEKIGPLLAQVRELFSRAVAAAQSEAGGLDFGLGALNIGGQITSGVLGSASSTSVDMAALTTALADVFNAADWRLDGSDLTLATNRGNLQLARR